MYVIYTCPSRSSVVKPPYIVYIHFYSQISSTCVLWIAYLQPKTHTHNFSDVVCREWVGLRIYTRARMRAIWLSTMQAHQSIKTKKLCRHGRDCLNPTLSLSLILAPILSREQTCIMCMSVLSVCLWMCERECVSVSTRHFPGTRVPACLSS
jgi:hypothetical protein